MRASYVAILVGSIVLSGCGDSNAPVDEGTLDAADSGTPRNSDSTRADAGGLTGETLTSGSDKSDTTARGGTSTGTSQTTLADVDGGETSFASNTNDSAPITDGSGSDTDDPDTTAEPTLPEGAGTLTELVVSGALSPAFDPDVREYDVELPVFATHLVLDMVEMPGTSITVDGKFLDAEGRWVSESLEVGTTTFTVELSARGTVLGSYRLNVARKEPSLSYLGNDDPLAYGYGYTTEVSGDGNTLVIGPATDSEGAPGVWAFTRNGDTWQTEAFVRHPNPPALDNRDWTLALNGDGNTLVAGAYGENAAYVFERQAGAWQLDAQLTNNEAYAFGRAVEISADGDTIVVGDDRFFTGQGGVFSFRRQGDRWKAQSDVVGLSELDSQGGCSLFSLSLALDEHGQTLAVAQASVMWGCAGAATVYENVAGEWGHATPIGEFGEDSTQTATDVDMNLAGTVIAVAGSEMQVFSKHGDAWERAPLWWPVSDTVKLTDSGNTLFTERSVYARSGNTWLEDGDIPWPNAIPENVSVGVAVNGDGTVLALGPFVYSLAPANWHALDEQPFGHTNCDDRADVRDDSCTYQLRCDQELVESTCDRGADGTWHCACFGEAQSEFKSVTSESGEADTICQSAALLCLDAYEPVDVDEDCKRESASYEDSCTLWTSCVTTTTVAGGVAFRVETAENGARCSAGDEGMTCGCDIYGEEGGRVLGAGADSACGIAQDYCEGKLTVSEDVVCLAPEITASDVGCETQRSCGFRTEVPDHPGASFIAEPDTSSSSCSAENGETACWCAPAFGHGTATVAVTTSDVADACRAADAVCTRDAALVASDAATCVDVYVESDVTTCSGVADCGPAEEYDGISVALAPRLTIACAMTTNSEWRCECASGDNTSAPFSAAGSDPSQVCEAAVVSCAASATRVDLTAASGVSLAFD